MFNAEAYKADLPAWPCTIGSTRGLGRGDDGQGFPQGGPNAGGGPKAEQGPEVRGNCTEIKIVHYWRLHGN